MNKLRVDGTQILKDLIIQHLKNLKKEIHRFDEIKRAYITTNHSEPAARANTGLLAYRRAYDELAKILFDVFPRNLSENIRLANEFNKPNRPQA